MESFLFDNPAIKTPRERDNRYYRLLAGGAKTRVLEAFLELGVPELLGSRGPMTGGAICDALKLDRHRGWKFLHLAAMTGLLTESAGEFGADEAEFGLSDEAKEYFGADGSDGYFFRDLVQYWKNVAFLPFNDVLRGMPLPEAVKWPPPHPDAAEHLETWMRITADGAIRTVLKSDCMAGAKTLLDVGGGDGTIGCALVEKYPDLAVTVFNLPNSAAIARRTIGARGLTHRVGLHEGDFLKDEFPGGYDRIMFSRVLTDWDADTCLMLLKKSRRAIAPGGRFIINEALYDGNEDYSISWEFRYVFYDTFGRAMFKPLRVYDHLLRQAGFEIVRVHPMIDDAFYSVIEAAPR